MNRLDDMRYIKNDINKEPLPEGPFDLVVNHFTAHHIGRLDYVFLQISKLLTRDGWFVSMDYVGPHRNQYPPQMWSRIQAVNRELPEKMRQDLDATRAHLPSMLAADPSEAQHSEMIMEVMRRYFYIRTFKPLGGAVAYPIFTHNMKFHAIPYGETEDTVKHVMKLDAQEFEEDPMRTLFAFVIAEPLKEGLPDERHQKILLRAELERESKGTQSTYYTPHCVLTDPCRLARLARA